MDHVWAVVGRPHVKMVRPRDGRMEQGEARVQSGRQSRGCEFTTEQTLANDTFDMFYAHMLILDDSVHGSGRP